MTVEHFETIEKLIKEALKQQEPSLTGLYLTLNGTNWSHDMVNNLKNDKILFDYEAENYEMTPR